MVHTEAPPTACMILIHSLVGVWSAATYLTTMRNIVDLNSRAGALLAQCRLGSQGLGASAFEEEGIGERVSWFEVFVP